MQQIDNPNYACRSCTMVRRNAENTDNQAWLDARQRGLEQMFAKNQNKQRIPQAVKTVRITMSGAKKRCTNPNTKSYKDYGGRGIEFRFDSVEQASNWIIANNKRAYQRGVVGERIRQIQIKRPDLCYETIRYAIKQGYSSEQIINKPRDTHYASL